MSVCVYLCIALLLRAATRTFHHLTHSSVTERSWRLSESPFVEMKEILAEQRKEVFTPPLPLSLLPSLCTARQAGDGSAAVFLPLQIPPSSGPTGVYVLDHSDEYMAERKDECAHSTTAECKRARPTCVKQTLVQPLQGLFPEFIFSPNQICMSSLKGPFQALFSPLVPLHHLSIPRTNKREYTRTDLDTGRRFCSGEDVLRLPKVPPLICAQSGLKKFGNIYVLPSFIDEACRYALL